jgi:anti-sigma factor RsiW
VALIADYLEGRLNPKVLATFEKHLGQCPDCTAFLNTYKKTIDATKSFLKFQLLNIPPKLKLPPQGRELLALFVFWLHLLISNVYLTT